MNGWDMRKYGEIRKEGGRKEEGGRLPHSYLHVADAVCGHRCSQDGMGGSTPPSPPFPPSPPDDNEDEPPKFSRLFRRKEDGTEEEEDEEEEDDDEAEDEDGPVDAPGTFILAAVNSQAAARISPAASPPPPRRLCALCMICSASALDIATLAESVKKGGGMYEGALPKPPPPATPFVFLPSSNSFTTKGWQQCIVLCCQQSRTSQVSHFHLQPLRGLLTPEIDCFNSATTLTTIRAS